LGSLDPRNNEWRQFVESEFYVDPSLPARDMEITTQQSLWLMNADVVQRRMRLGDAGRLKPSGPVAPATLREMNLVDQVFARQLSDAEAVQFLYSRVLARAPTERETGACQDYLRQAGEEPRVRARALEDLLWVLVNSTEFLTKQ
jgi:hypothetical protein